MDIYKNSKEWIALNNIWKNTSSSVRENNINDFKLLTELMKEE